MVKVSLWIAEDGAVRRSLRRRSEALLRAEPLRAPIARRMIAKA
jgi:hypothetical protein